MPDQHDIVLREIGELRQAGQSVEAFQRAIAHMTQESVFQGDALACWMRHFQRGQCLLLEFARAAREFPDELSQGFAALESDSFQQRVFGFQGGFSNCKQLLKARLAMLRALTCRTENPDAIESELRKAVLLYDSEWSDGSRIARTNDGRKSPSMPHCDLWEEHFASLAEHEHIGRLSPGLATARDTAACLWADARGPRPAERSVETWALLVSKRPMIDDEEGLLARLTLEKVPGGGAIYPHPLSAGYLLLDADFRHGLANARQVAMGGRLLDYDVRWRVEVIDSADQSPAISELTGPSAELAFACALRALAAGEPLDRHVAVTARFEDPANAPFKLAPVGSVALKLSARALKEWQIDEVVVAPAQKELKTLADGKVPLVAAADFESAWQKLSRWRRMTTLACQGIAAEAAAKLADSCGKGNKFVIPSLSQRREVSGEDRIRREEPDEDHVPLADEEVQDVLLQRNRRPLRTRLLADSGLGKSTFLLYAQQQIALANDGRLPILAPYLSDLTGLDYEQAIEQLSSGLLAHLQDHQAHAVNWLKRLIQNGEVVFLFDALDQTTTLDGFANFIDRVSGGATTCPVLLSGRPFVLNSKSAAFRGEWQTLRLDPFDRPRQEEYLGQELAARLLIEDGLEWRDSAEYVKRRQWADLLEVPLLLKLMRDLASTNKLDGLVNRHAIYAEAVAELVIQGKKSLAETQYAGKVVRLFDVERILCPVAWQMIARGNFTGLAVGRQFAALRGLEDPELLQAITQINLTTLECLLDDPGPDRFAWRHLSFCEYFAGLHLARGYASDDDLAKTVRNNARDPQWHWTLRFALSELQNLGEDPAPLAADLIRFGNPFVVADALRHDRLKLPAELDRFCLWLVHYVYEWRDCWDESWSKPTPSEPVLALLESLFRREHRDSRCLYAAWELLEDFPAEQAKPIFDRFQGELARILNGELGRDRQAVAQEFLQGFAPIPPNCQLDADLEFRMGSPDGEAGQDNDEQIHPVRINRPFQLHRFPVTNGVFELFDPSHERTQYSPEDSSPAVYVSWYQATLFCRWLGESAEGGRYRLPSEAEWEFACRAGEPTAYWFGDDPDQLPEHAWFDANSNGQAQPVGAVGHFNRWGLCDMHGNVWEWCQDWYDPEWYAKRARQAADGAALADCDPPAGVSRVLRGGGWYDLADVCRSAYRAHYGPGDLYDGIGFRVSCVLD